MISNINGFNHFLLTGRLGPLTIGMHAAEVVALLGLPEGTSNGPPEYQESIGPDEYKLNIYAYNDHDLQLTFGNNILDMLGVYFYYVREHRAAGSLPAQLNASWYPHIHKMTYRAFVAYARQHDIACMRAGPPFTNDEGYLVEVQTSGVRLAFTEGKRNVIKKIFYAAPATRVQYEYQPLT